MSSPVRERNDAIWAGKAQGKVIVKSEPVDLVLGLGLENGGGGKEKGKEKEAEAEQVKKFRGVPENVKLFEVFWHQVVELIKVSVCTTEASLRCS